MSGGHWDYAGSRIKYELEGIAADGDLQGDAPRLAIVIGKLANILYRIEHDLDWHYSSDSSIRDFAAFEKKALAELQAATFITTAQEVLDVAIKTHDK